jgi:hypothetical protein
MYFDYIAMSDEEFLHEAAAESMARLAVADGAVPSMPPGVSVVEGDRSQDESKARDFTREADQIWDDYRRNYRNSSSFKALEPAERIRLFHHKYREFFGVWSLVVRFMVEYDLYHPKAFALYVNGMRERPPRTNEDYANAFGQYVGNVHWCVARQNHQRIDQHAIRLTKKDIAEQLLTELTHTDKEKDRITKEFQQLDAEQLEEHRDELVADMLRFGESYKAQMADGSD